MTPFANQVALVTGAASGIGRQLALDLSAQGAAVAAIDLQPEPLAKLASELSGRPFASAVADVTDRPALHAAVSQLEERLGPIDVLVANAGIGRETSALMFNAADFEDIVRVNLIGVANSIEAVLPGMLKRRRGHLLAISSLAAYHGIPGLAGYCASKSGVNALLEAFRIELKPLGVAVTIVCPGWIRTPLTADIDIPAAKLMEPAEASRRILDAVGQRRPFVAFPPRAAWQLRLLRWLPCAASDWLVARLVRSVSKK